MCLNSQRDVLDTSSELKLMLEKLHQVSWHIFLNKIKCIGEYSHLHDGEYGDELFRVKLGEPYIYIGDSHIVVPLREYDERVTVKYVDSGAERMLLKRLLFPCSKHNLEVLEREKYLDRIGKIVEKAIDRLKKKEANPRT